MQNYFDSIEQYLGASCEVLHLDNRFLFAGTIQRYDEDSEELTVSVRNQSAAPQGIIHRTPVKLHVGSKVSSSDVVLLYGLVTRCAAGAWKITLKHTFSCSERRSSFRQPISTTALVHRMSSEEASEEETCLLTDISLTGLSFHSQTAYEPGEQITISGLQLRQNGRIYQFDCTVQRIQQMDDHQSPTYRYGCRFNRITERQEDRLFQDMFSLQVQALNQQ